MNKKMTIAVTGALALALTGAGAGAAMASTSHTGASISTVSAVHSLNTATSSPEKAGTESSTESDGPGGHADATNVDVNYQDGTTDTTAAESSTESSTAESSTVSDGPGGHADASTGNVDHQGGANEQ
jgi:hypothetical protein